MQDTGIASQSCELHIVIRNTFIVYPKMVYPRIMELFGCTRSALDRNIRFAIERTWENGNQTLLSQLFGAFGTNWTPTNIEFISVMTDFILYGSFEDPSSDEKLQAEAL